MTESGRDALKMAEPEVWAFLEEHRRIEVASNGPQGWPHVVPMSYFVEDGSIMLWTDGSSQKIKNVRRDDRVTCLVEEGDQVDNFRAVQVQGRAELLEDYQTSSEVGTHLFERYAGGPLDEAGQAYVSALANQRVGVRIRPDRVVSWDHRKMSIDVRDIGS